MNEKVRTQSHMEGRRFERHSLSRCRYVLNPLSCAMLAWPHLFTVAPAPLWEKMFATPMTEDQSVIINNIKIIEKNGQRT